jgi:hypothetical protein
MNLCLRSSLEGLLRFSSILYMCAKAPEHQLGGTLGHEHVHKDRNRTALHANIII